MQNGGIGAFWHEQGQRALNVGLFDRHEKNELSRYQLS